MQFDHWTVVLLCRRDDPPALSETASDAVQDAHLAHLAQLHADGPLLAAGPVQGTSASKVAGVCLFRVGPEQAQSLLAADPAVKAGYFRVEVLTWSVPGGAVQFTPTLFPRSMADVTRE